MHRGNYEMISQAPYMVTWKSSGKRYMMLIEDEGRVYMLDPGSVLFSVANIEFPYDVEYTRHLRNTLVDGELVMDHDGDSEKAEFWMNDIITYHGRKVSEKSLPERLMLISESIVNIRNEAMTRGRIDRTAQPFSIRFKDYFPLSAVTKLLSPEFRANILHAVEGLVFQPVNEPYTLGECPHVLTWKENTQIVFRLQITDNSSKQNTPTEKEAHLFLNRNVKPFAKMQYSPDLEAYDNKIISCLFREGQWHFHRLRDDKPYPNSLQTATEHMKAVENQVTREALCDLIKTLPLESVQ